MKSKRKNQKVVRGNSPAPSSQIKFIVTAISPPVKKVMAMPAYELFQEFTDKGCNRQIMAKTGLHKSQLSRWSETGNVSNPLERTAQLAEATAGDDAVPLWLGERLNCTLVPNPKPGAPAPNLPAAGDAAEQQLAAAISYIVTVKNQPASREGSVQLHRLVERAKVRLEVFMRAYEQSSFRCAAFFYPLLDRCLSGELPLAA
jgi:hypothetical protein